MSFNHLKIIATSIIAAAVTLISSNAHAGPDGNRFEGMYVGIITTKSTFEATGAYEQVFNILTPPNFAGITSTTSKDSWGLGMMGGYGLSYGMFYTSAEAAFIVDKGNTIFSDGTNSIKISQSNTFEISARAGLTFSDRFLAYGLIGYSGAVIKSNGVNNLQKQDLDYNKRLTSFRYGGGVEMAIVENIALRLEYTRSKLASAFYPDGSDHFTFKPETSRIMLSFVLHMY